MIIVRFFGIFFIILIVLSLILDRTPDGKGAFMDDCLRHQTVKTCETNWNYRRG